MKRLLATVAVFGAVSGTALAAAPATVSLPDNFQQLEQQLEPGCGQDRAKVIAQLTWDIDIHRQWAALVEAHGADPKTVGTPTWHRYWVSVYQRAIGMLAADCRRAT